MLGLLLLLVLLLALRSMGRDSCAQAPLFFRCDRALVGALCSVLRRAIFVSGEVIAREGEVVRELFFLESGRVMQANLIDSDEEDEAIRADLLAARRRGMGGAEEEGEAEGGAPQHSHAYRLDVVPSAMAFWARLGFVEVEATGEQAYYAERGGDRPMVLWLPLPS